MNAMDKKYIDKKEVLRMGEKELKKYDIEQIEKVLKSFTGMYNLSIKEIFYNNSSDTNFVHCLYIFLDDPYTLYEGIAENLEQLVKNIVDKKNRVDSARRNAFINSMNDTLCDLISRFNNEYCISINKDEHKEFLQNLHKFAQLALDKLGDII